MAIAERPFEDDYGVGAHFEALALKTGQKQVNQLKVDFHTSVIKLARAAAMHKPRLIYGEGQGGLVALGYAHPGFLEAVMASRNVQPAELPELCQAWGNVAAVVIHKPRLSKVGVQLEMIRQAAPALFQGIPG